METIRMEIDEKAQLNKWQEVRKYNSKKTRFSQKNKTFKHDKKKC